MEDISGKIEQLFHTRVQELMQEEGTSKQWSSLVEVLRPCSKHLPALQTTCLKLAEDQHASALAGEQRASLRALGADLVEKATLDKIPAFGRNCGQLGNDLLQRRDPLHEQRLCILDPIVLAAHRLTEANTLLVCVAAKTVFLPVRCRVLKRAHTHARMC